MRKLKRKKQRKGAILALMVMVVLLLSMSSLALIGVGTEARLRTVRSDLQTAARFAADGGIERALYLMNQQLEAGTWTLDDVPTYNAHPLTASNADYTVGFSGSLINGYQITAEGRSGNQEKTVRATVALTSPIAEDFAVFCRNELIAKSKSEIGGYNSSDPSDTDVDVKIGTQGTGDNAINLKKNTDINADIIIGPGGDPDAVIKSKDQLNINGEIFTLPIDYDLPPVTAPDYTASQGAIAGKNVALNASDSGKYSSINISNGGTLSVNGDLTLYITGDIDLKKDAEIEVKENATLEIYFDGDIDAQNSSGFNNKTEIPANLKLYGTGTNQKIDIKNSSDLYGVVYAPNVEMTVHNNVDAYGSFIVNNFELKNGGQVYYDEALKQVNENDPLVHFTITRWEEL
jgi:hypothetical protein